MPNMPTTVDVIELVTFGFGADPEAPWWGARQLLAPGPIGKKCVAETTIVTGKTSTINDEWVLDVVHQSFAAYSAPVFDNSGSGRRPAQEVVIRPPDPRLKRGTPSISPDQSIKCSAPQFPTTVIQRLNLK